MVNKKLQLITTNNYELQLTTSTHFHIITFTHLHINASTKIGGFNEKNMVKS